MVEELKLAIKIDDATVEQSLLKQFANAQKMADKVVLDFKNVNFDDKQIEAKFKEMQKKAGQNPIDLSISGNTLDMLGQIDKRLTEIFSIGKGKSFIDSSSTVADIGKIENKINELNKKYEEMQKKLSSVGSEGISGKDVSLVDNAEFQKLSQEVQNTKSELSDLKDVISNLTSDNEGLGNFADQLDDRLRGLDNTVLDLTKRLQTLYSVIEQNPETNISSGNQIVESQNKIQDELDETVAKINNVGKAYDTMAYRGIEAEEAVAKASKNYNGATHWSSDEKIARGYGDIVTSGNISLKNAFEVDGNGAYWDKIQILGDGLEENSKKAIEFSTSIDKVYSELSTLLTLNGDFNKFNPGFTLYSSIGEEISKLSEEQKSQDDSEAKITSEKIQRLAKIRDLYADLVVEYDKFSRDTSHPYGLKTTDELTKYAQANGYDGAIYKNIIDAKNSPIVSGNEYIETSNIIVSFYENQVKYLEKISRKGQEYIRENISNLNTTSPIKDVFQGDKIEQATTSAKELDKTLEQVDIPTDSFDKVLEKLDRTKSELVDIVKITKQSVSDADGKFHDSYTLKDSRGSTEIYDVNSKTDKGQILRQNIVGYDKKKDELDISKAQLEVDKQLAKEEDNLAKAQQKKAQAFLKEQANYEEDQKKAELIKRQTLAYEELTDTISKYSEVAKRVAGGNAEDGDLELMTKLEDKISQLQKQPILSDSQVSKSEKSLVSLYDQLDKIERKLVETNQKSQDKQIAGFDKRLESYTKKTSGYNATIARFNDGGWTSDAYLKNVQAVKDAVKQYEDLLSDIKAKGGIASEDDIQKLKEYESEIKDTIATVTNMSAAEKGYNFVSGQKELDKIHKLLNENSKMSSEAKAKIKAYYAEIESGNPSMSLDKIHGEILKIYNAEVEAGRAGRTLWDTMKHSGFHQIAAQMAGMIGVYDVINIFKQGANTLKEFDDGLTKISYTMDMTKSQLDGLGKSVLETANDIDSSIDNAMQVSQIYANMNTSAEEIKKLSEPTLILSNLTGFDASTVADDIQAVTQQFEISAEESMHIADVYDQISRNISVDYSKILELILETI